MEQNENGFNTIEINSDLIEFITLWNSEVWLEKKKKKMSWEELTYIQNKVFYSFNV